MNRKCKHKEIIEMMGVYGLSYKWCKNCGCLKKDSLNYFIGRHIKGKWKKPKINEYKC